MTAEPAWVRPAQGIAGGSTRSLGSAAVIFTLALPASVVAAGFQTLEQGTSDMGRAIVGAASIADSATTAYWNPAGMTRLRQPELVGGAMIDFQRRL